MKERKRKRILKALASKAAIRDIIRFSQLASGKPGEGNKTPKPNPVCSEAETVARFTAGIGPKRAAKRPREKLDPSSPSPPQDPAMKRQRKRERKEQERLEARKAKERERLEARQAKEQGLLDAKKEKEREEAREKKKALLKAQHKGVRKVRKQTETAVEGLLALQAL